MTELEEIKVRAWVVIEHFEYWSAHWTKRRDSTTAAHCQRQADLVKGVLGEEQESWKLTFFEREE